MVWTSGALASIAQVRVAIVALARVGVASSSSRGPDDTTAAVAVVADASIVVWPRFRSPTRLVVERPFQDRWKLYVRRVRPTEHILSEVLEVSCP
jgi:hypothetical protein